MVAATVEQDVDATQDLLARMHAVRRQSLLLCEPLTPEDMMVQSCPEASPAKWHLAHTTWFFETFLLREFAENYRPLNEDYRWLFNSYYNSVSDQPEKKLRASFSRPSLDDILAYRAHVDAGLDRLFSADAPEEASCRLVLGLHHEQQHAELLLTDVKHALWNNPLRPAYAERALPSVAGRPVPSSWRPFDEGLYAIGHQGPGFCFDNEEPRHKVWLGAFALAAQPVSCADYLAFMEDGGYRRADLWLSEGWAAVQAEGWQAPLYWQRNEDGEWVVFTLRGEQPLSALLDTPVCHVSYFEADAYARWAGASLPLEAEWEIAAGSCVPDAGTLLDGGSLHPVAQGEGFQVFGNAWQWTASAYLGYPGYAALPGALGEYNGKFMCNQMVLRGGSVATPVSHIRASYRNFFSPATRWQFSGIRLARR